MEKINQFLQTISWEAGQEMEFVFNSCNPEKNKFFRTLFLTIYNFLEQWQLFLKQRKGQEISAGNITTFGMIISEAIKNANDHGNEWNPNKKISVMIWTGDKGILTAIRDEGSFFKEKQAKVSFESKTPSKEEWAPKHSENSHLGVAMIYCTDELFVDIETGYLYMLWLFK